jgi:hypothetical protein
MTRLLRAAFVASIILLVLAPHTKIARADTLSGGFTSPLPVNQGGTGQAVLSDGPTFKVKRGTAGCATSAVINTTCTTTVTWTTAFADANYTAVCIGLSAFTGTPVLQGETAKVAASVTVQTINLTAAASSFAAIECMAWHD